MGYAIINKYDTSLYDVLSYDKDWKCVYMAYDYVPIIGKHKEYSVALSHDLVNFLSEYLILRFSHSNIAEMVSDNEYLHFIWTKKEISFDRDGKSTIIQGSIDDCIQTLSERFHNAIQLLAKDKLIYGT